MTSTQLLSELVMTTLRKPLISLGAADRDAVMRTATALWAAYRTVLLEGPWPELGEPAAETAVVANKLTREDLGNPQHVVVYAANPEPDPRKVRVLKVTAQDTESYHLNNGSLTPVWVRTWPQPPTFIPTGETAGAVGLAYAVVYDHTTRKLYREKAGSATTSTADLADTAKWTPDPEIWTQAADYILLAAQAKVLGNMEQERGQQSKLERDARDELERLYDVHLYPFYDSINNPVR